MKKNKVLFVLHQSPPPHGAGKVGDFIASSNKLKDYYQARFIKIESSERIEDIGKYSLKKIFLAVSLFCKVFYALVVFRPKKIYFTASISNVAFYRDLFISSLWKVYKLFKKADIYYHYHTKGIDEFVSTSRINLILTSFFIRNVNLILLSNLLSDDFNKVRTYKEIFYLPNGIKDSIDDDLFRKSIDFKYRNMNGINILYLSHMTTNKGYKSVLDLALKTKKDNTHYNFAGEWGCKEDKDFFFSFIEKNSLNDKVTYHGFVSGDEKSALFNRSHVLAYPSRNDAFPLTILESLSHGVPVISSNEGSIPFILDNKCGLVIKELHNFPALFEEYKRKLLNQETALYCREKFLRDFTLDIFLNNLTNILD